MGDYEIFMNVLWQKLEIKQMKMERHNFCGIYFCDWSSDNVLGNFFGVLGTNAQKLIKHQIILKKIIPLR